MQKTIENILEVDGLDVIVTVIPKFPKVSKKSEYWSDTRGPAGVSHPPIDKVIKKAGKRGAFSVYDGGWEYKGKITGVRYIIGDKEELTLSFNDFEKAGRPALIKRKISYSPLKKIKS